VQALIRIRRLFGDVSIRGGAFLKEEHAYAAPHPSRIMSICFFGFEPSVHLFEKWQRRRVQVTENLFSKSGCHWLDSRKYTLEISGLIWLPQKVVRKV
jgi:hypothetical protein